LARLSGAHSVWQVIDPLARTTGQGRSRGSHLEEVLMLRSPRARVQQEPSARADRSHQYAGRFTSAATLQAVGVLALAGMAYCHFEDVGMKFDEHVYYMAALFCCNIAASLLLIPAVIVYGNGHDRRARAVWMAAGALSLLTIAGFLWSRTIGFPQMQDHVGEWDALGLTSVAFESLIVALSAWRLAPTRMLVASPRVGVR